LRLLAIEAMSPRNPSAISIPIAVMTYDIDYARIVHNAVYVRWLEDLRTALISDAYPIESMLDDGISPILTKTEIEYRLPIRFGENVIGSMWVSDLGRTRWKIEAELRVGEQIRTHARQEGYFADARTLRPTRIPAHLRTLWQS
jgi:acyl-CoA thioester hydrolase